MFRVMLLLLLFSRLQAQSFNGAPFRGMGDTGVALQSVYSLTNNPAGIAHLKNISVALAFQPNFLSSDLRSQALYLAIPLNRTTAVGLSLNSYGISGVSNLLKAKASYVRTFGSDLTCALSANYHRFYVKGYYSTQTFSSDLGFLYRLSSSIHLGVHWQNISFSTFSDDSGQYIEQRVATGIAYKVSEELTLATDVNYDLKSGMDYRGGLSYQLARFMVIRGGISSGPLQYFAGIGIHYLSFDLDMSNSFHQRLGSSPQIALAYAF